MVASPQAMFTHSNVATLACKYTIYMYTNSAVTINCSRHSLSKCVYELLAIMQSLPTPCTEKKKKALNTLSPGFLTVQFL